MFWLGRFSHSFEHTQPLISLSSYFLSSLTPLPFPHQGFTRLSHPKQSTKPKDNQFQRLCAVLVEILNDSLFTAELLKYPGPIFAWWRTGWDLSYSRWKNRHTMKAFFNSLKRMEVFTPIWDRQVVFSPTLFTETGQWPQPQSQKRMTRLKVAFVLSPKSPNQTEVSLTHSLFENVEGKSREWSKQKIQLVPHLCPFVPN